MQSPNNSIHFAHFCCNEFIPLEKKIFWLLFKPGRDRLLDLGEVLCFHFMDSILVSGSLWYAQVSSPVTKR